MKNLITAALVTFFLFSCRQNDKVAESTTGEMVIGQVDSIYSNVLNESRKLWIHIPESAKENTSKVKYPVLYVLDGPSHFHALSGMIKQLSTNGNTVVPEMIVIAIPNTDRSRDLTPTEVFIDEISGDSIQYATGGGDKFLDFIEQELIPHVEQTYPASPYRTFVGHSFGGLSVLNALVNRKHLFNNYVAIDPSLWWDNQAFLNNADSLLTVNKFDDKALYLGVANTMLSGIDINIVQSDSVASTIFTVHIKSLLKFAQSMDVKEENKLDFSWKYYENDDHGSVPLITEYDALRFLFSWHKIKGLNEFFLPNSNSSGEDLINLISSHYKEISNHFGYEVKAPEQFINTYGHAFIFENMPKKSFALFDWNIQNYPKSASVYDSMGEFYLSESDTLNSIKYFKKALEIDENHDAKEKLIKLEGRK